MPISFTATADQIAKHLIPALSEEIRKQGHRLTGALEKSFEHRTKNVTDGVDIEFWRNNYGRFVNRGVRASRIPYSGRSGTGGTSKYIQGLKRFAELRGMGRGKRALQIAFAIAAKHRKEGMPTRPSFRFSKNGRRKGFEDWTLKEQENKIAAIATDKMLTAIDLDVMGMVDKYDVLINSN